MLCETSGVDAERFVLRTGVVGVLTGGTGEHETGGVRAVCQGAGLLSRSSACVIEPSDASGVLNDWEKSCDATCGVAVSITDVC